MSRAPSVLSARWQGPGSGSPRLGQVFSNSLYLVDVDLQVGHLLLLPFLLLPLLLFLLLPLLSFGRLLWQTRLSSVVQYNVQYLFHLADPQVEAQPDGEVLAQVVDGGLHLQHGSAQLKSWRLLKVTIGCVWP